ncbi:tRNA (adenosine(37)-N6)-dimethylallyltransferase MiaA [Aegicerativicinus sediminis]|uniref:tRNA (adenosine(37)-N6)-dimethylallyltransferase MiaA n=1 Tax=Aegicerativicinus sediminis TaxID=2893202 RepID=UPI001E2C987B|nr:tRNA (adenosine(37)-N6)-dimethylallyltransferase MiaA [Aegicerativicinus sediminis]
MTKFLIIVVGPTGIGKTALSIQLAKHFNTEILSSDSRQFYKEMKIGTAVPSDLELNAAPHHFIQHISIKDKYSVGDFEREAIERIGRLFRVHDILIMAGGSGLYIEAVVKGLDNFPEVDPKIRKDLMKILENQGLLPLQQKLNELDPYYYQNADINNPHRIVRALEICLGTRKPYSSFLTGSPIERNFTPIYIGLTGEREDIYNRINKRVDQMIREGLIDEVGELLQHKNLNALNTVGYKELFEYLDEKTDLETAISEIKKNSRRYAKRQLTWLRKNDAVHWFNYKTSYSEIVEYIEKLISHEDF